MANVTVSERVKFLTQTAELMIELNKHSMETLESLEAVAKRINVSSMYKLRNIFDEAAGEICTSIRKKDQDIIEVLEVLNADKYNEGEYKTIIKNALVTVESDMPAAYFSSVMSTDANAQEDVSAANVNALNDIIAQYGSKAKSILMQLSAVAGHLKSDDSIGMATKIGASVEEMTNKMIVLHANCNESIAEFAKAYNLTLSSIEDLAADALKASTNFSTDGEIKMSCN